MNVLFQLCFSNSVYENCTINNCLQFEMLTGLMLVVFSYTADNILTKKNLILKFSNNFHSFLIYDCMCDSSYMYNISFIVVCFFNILYQKLTLRGLCAV